MKENSQIVNTEHLVGSLLIASPNIEDSFFDKNVIYICESNKDGTLGIALTTPTDLSVSELIFRIMPTKIKDYQFGQNNFVLAGGPVNLEQGFVIHTKSKKIFNSCLKVTENIYVTTSLDVIDVIGTAEEPEKMLMALGCCVWYPGQLEYELRQNYWLNLPEADPILFDTAYNKRWLLATQQLGIKPSNFIPDKISWN